MTGLRSLKILLAGVIAAFAAATIYTSVVIGERQDALRNTSRYNVSWLASQASNEFARFIERVSSASLPGSGVDADEVRLRFDILHNRVNLFEDGDFREFVRTDPEFARTVRDFAELLAKLEPLVARVDEPGVAPRVHELVRPLEGRLVRLAAGANRFGGERAAADQQDLLALHRLFSLLAIGLILCGLALMGLMLWHNVLLGRAHRRVNALAQDLGHTSAQLNAALNNMSQGLCMVDRDERLTLCNAQLTRLLDLAPGAARPGRAIADVFGPVVYALAAPGAGHVTASFSQEMPDGRTLAVSRQFLPNGGWVATYEDVTERRRAEQRIAHLAHHDVLTGLANRARFLHRLDECFAHAARGEPVAVLSLDLDRFKIVNDTLGHPMGDRLLCQVAERLGEVAGKADLVARFGGDEFAILQVGGEQPREADELARRITRALSAPYDLDGSEMVIGTSLGISVAPTDGASGEELLKNADMALYRGKAEGRGTHRFFEPAMDAQLRARRALELDLRGALAREEFELHYQALVDVRSGAVAGYEALLRWRHPVRGLVSPAEFIPIAEEVGLIVPIGEWVIREACREAATWPAGIKVAVNLSSVQFRTRGLLPTVVSALALSGLPARRLELEITETVLLDDNEATLEVLHALRDLGTRIALDDFGTGFASLSYLRNFPFDKIKIDRSFVRDSERVDCMAIIQSVATLAADLGMTTTAEGIETPEQFGRVRAARCTEGQGYLFARPLPAAELSHRLGRDAAALLAA